MLLVPLVSFVFVKDSVPGSSQLTAGPAETVDDRLERIAATERASRSRAQATAFDAANADPPTTTSTTESPPTTTALPTTSVPPKPAVKAAAKAAAPVTTTTAKRTTTTTAKPKPTTTVAPTTTTTAPPNRQEGGASYYESRSASTCAHRTITFGTVVRVTNLANGKRTTCTVADRGPYIDGRIIDLSPQSFANLAPVEEGVIRVAVEW